MYNFLMENILWLVMFRRLCQVLQPGELTFRSLGTMTHLPEVDAYWNDIQHQFDLTSLKAAIIIPGPVKNG